MHIVIAAHDFYPDPGSGGTGRYVYETARRFTDRGYDVSVITRRRGPVPKTETLEGIDVYRYDFAVANEHAPRIFAQLPRAASTISHHLKAATAKAGSPAILSYQGPVTAMLIDRLIHSPQAKIATFHSPWSTEYRIKTNGPDGATGIRRRLNIRLRRYLERRLITDVDEAVTLSDFMARELNRVHGDSCRTTVIPGGVDTDRFTPHGPRIDRIRGDPAYLTVRRLSPRMGIDRLIEAFAAVHATRPDARLYIAGDGSIRPRLEESARSYGIGEATTFLGYIPDESLPGLYRSADIFVLPTTKLEGFGLVTLEALASGLPVVATAVGGTTEILSSLESKARIPEPLLVPATDTPALARAMERWAGRQAEDRAQAAQTCREYVTHRYQWDTAVTRLISLYREHLRNTDRSR